MKAKKTKKVVSKKKIVKKTKKVSTPRSIKNELVIRVEQPQAIKESDLSPEKDAGKFRVVKSWLSEGQVLRMIQKTPKHIVLKRKGRGGQEFDYVPGWYFKKALNFGFGWNWDFHIAKQEIVGAIGSDGTQVITTGRLVVKDDQGHTITKEDNGKAEIKYLKGTKIPMDIGNDYKASATDALKRCCVQLGIASDIYGKGEMSEVGAVVYPDKPAGPKEDMPAIGAPKVHVETVTAEYDCHGAGKGGCPAGASISKAEHDFSLKMFGKPLCRECQKVAKSQK